MHDGDGKPPRRATARGALGALGSVLVEVIYPRRCAGCARRGTWVCADCDAALPRLAPPWCERCGVPGGADVCRCATLPPALGAVRSAAPFDGWLRRAVHAFKYQDERARADHLGDLLAWVVAGLGPVDGLAPVPLHPSRQRRRGYNQSALLAERVGAVLGVPVLPALDRVRATAQQVGLGGADRERNVAGAFAANATRCGGLRLVLIDDVVTTGSTLGACAVALAEAGAVAVAAATLAREL
jgi:ComF family protein